MLLNPFFLYSITWVGILILYVLEISNLYPKLSNELIIFIFITIFGAIAFGIFYNKKFKENKFLKKIEKKYEYIYTILFIYFFIEFLFVGKIPLIETIQKTGYTYVDFKGIKTLHIVFLTYNFYINLCVFNDFWSIQKKRYLFYSVLGLIPYVFLYLRGAILLICTCYFFIWLFYKYKIKTVIQISALGLIFLYLFGVLGNIRHYQKWNDTKAMKNLIQINTSENILDPFIWSYVYITSPLGNLQYNLIKSEPTYNIRSFIYENLLLDAMSKRLKYKSNEFNLMNKALTASTVYIRPYLSYGNLGMILIFFIYMSCELIYLLILKKSKYLIIGVVLVSMLNIFSIFDNVYIHSSISFSLIYPLIDMAIDKKELKRKFKRSR